MGKPKSVVPSTLAQPFDFRSRLSMSQESLKNNSSDNKSRKSATPTLKAFMETQKPHMLVKDFNQDKSLRPSSTQKAGEISGRSLVNKQPIQGGGFSTITSNESGSASVRMPALFGVLGQDPTFSG